MVTALLDTVKMVIIIQWWIIDTGNCASKYNYNYLMNLKYQHACIQWKLGASNNDNMDIKYT